MCTRRRCDYFGRPAAHVRIVRTYVFESVRARVRKHHQTTELARKLACKRASELGAAFGRGCVCCTHARTHARTHFQRGVRLPIYPPLRVWPRDTRHMGLFGAVEAKVPP